MPAGGDGLGIPEELILFLIQEDRYKRVLNVHRRDGSGRCRECTTPRQSVPWPCLIRDAAVDAQTQVMLRAAKPVPTQRKAPHDAVDRLPTGEASRSEPVGNTDHEPTR